MKPLVVITDCNLGNPGPEVSILEAGLGAEVRLASCRTEDDVIAAAVGADGLMVQWAPISDRVLAALPNLRAISRYGIGLDMIDLGSAQGRGIAVANVPHYCTEEVATHAAAMLFALWRRLPRLDASTRAGEWAALATMEGVKRLSDSTLGLLGAGRIARLAARPFAALGARVIAYDPYAEPVDGIELVDLHTLAGADLLSLHAPLTDETRHIVDAAFLSRMSSHAVLVNTARGQLLDEEALIEALRARRIAGAGLDVFDQEPLSAGHPLTALDNVLLTPHAAWCSTEALPTLKRQAAEHLVDLLRA